MTIKTNVKAGGREINHNETLAVLRRFSGTSNKGDFREALASAIAEAKQGLGTDLVRWTLLLVTGVNGGFAGQNDLTVHIKATACS